MTDNGVDVSYPTIESIVAIYNRHGFEVVGYRRAGDDGADVHRIRILGDSPDAGLRAIEVANAYGLRLFQGSLQEDWELRDEDRVERAEQGDIWQLNFKPTESEVSGNGTR